MDRDGGYVTTDRPVVFGTSTWNQCNDGDSIRADPVFCAFNLFWHDRADLRVLKLIERKRRLRRLIRPCRCAGLLFADHIEERGIDFFRAVCECDCEGIIAEHKLGTHTTAGPAA